MTTRRWAVSSGRGTAARVITGIGALFALILVIYILMNLFNANPANGFFQFIKSVTDPFYSPFRGLMPSPSTPEGFTLALPIIIAIVVYMLLHLAINGFLRLLAHRKVEI